MHRGGGCVSALDTCEAGDDAEVGAETEMETAGREFDADQWDTAIDEEASPLRLNEDAADAHQQVLEMAATIQLLSKDFESLQRELVDAYKRLQEYSTQGTRGAAPAAGPAAATSTTGKAGGIVSNAITKMHMEEQESTNTPEQCCNHQAELDELKRLLEIKDLALTEALQDRNHYKLELEKVERIVRDRRLKPSGGGGDSSPPRGISPYGRTSTSPARITPTIHPHTTNTTPRSVSKRERFDHESEYRCGEADTSFWRRQYRDAVRMRKKPEQRSFAAVSQGPRQSGPSLKIFSRPNAHLKRSSTDENLPFARYIGISSRQSEIIKEHHRLLS